MILRLKKKGSNRATKSEVEAKVVSVMETLDTFRASKKKIQWAAVTNPMPRYFAAFNGVVLNFRFVRNMKTASPAKAMDMRHQTMDIEGIWISRPKIPVKPHKKMTEF